MNLKNVLSFPFLLSLFFFTIFSCKEQSGSLETEQSDEEGDESSAPDDNETDSVSYIKYNNITATDGLGRKLPSWEQVGDKKKDKFVALFYWTWHTQQSDFGVRPAYNVSTILESNPEAINNYNDPSWPKNASSFFWGEPLFGYYLNTDEWVLRKHAELLSLAGIDVIVFDCTNGSFTWKESYMKLCEVFQQARKDGVKTPQIAFLLAFSPTEGSKQAIKEIYNELYKPGIYEDLFFYWKGKPLIMAYPDNLPSDIRDYFTFRPGQPTYDQGPSRDDQWGWLEIFPQHLYPSGSNEQVPVGVAQNWSSERGLTAMNAPNTFGRSYTNEGGQVGGKDAVNYGYNFQEQWERAFELDPELIFVTGWNEWIAGRYENWQDQYNAFPDEFSQEKSRDIEPMKGGHGDNYYYQLASNVRRFKGIDPPETASEPATISLTGNLEEWNQVRPIYQTPKGNTAWRDHIGWGELPYVNKTGRNDFVQIRVTMDDDFLYFLVKTEEPFTSPRDNNWCWLFLDIDRSQKTGWNGYDFVINRPVSTESKMTIEKNEGGWEWNNVGNADYTLDDKVLEIKIPREVIDATGELNFEFKLADNIQNPGDVMDFYVSGDTAPLGRFNFVYKE